MNQTIITPAHAANLRASASGARRDLFGPSLEGGVNAAAQLPAAFLASLARILQRDRRIDPRDSCFSVPASRYFQRQSFEPFGLSKRNRP
jgi:hypothetical protein